MTDDAAEGADGGTAEPGESAERDEPSDAPDAGSAGPSGAAEPSDAEPSTDAGPGGDATAPADAESPGGDGGSADAAESDPGADGRGPGASPADGLVDRVAAHDAELAEAVAAVVDERDELAGELESASAELAAAREEAEELRDRLKRKQAEFQNYKKRAEQRREQLRERATEDLVERLVPVRDNLVRALEQEADADIRPGVESTLEEFDRVLDEEGVDVLRPAPGDEVDPQRHEVMLRVDSEQPAGTIAEVYRPGYEMGGRVVRAAQVTVSDDSGGGEGGSDDGGNADPEPSGADAGPAGDDGRDQ